MKIIPYAWVEQNCSYMATTLSQMDVFISRGWIFLLEISYVYDSFFSVGDSFSQNLKSGFLYSLMVVFGEERPGGWCEGYLSNWVKLFRNHSYK